MIPVALVDGAQATVSPASAKDCGSDAVLFVGSNFYANREAVAFLVRELAPSLQRRGETQVWIAGNCFNRSDWHEELPTNVRMLGHVEDLTALYRNAAAFVAPIFSGGGMKVKVAESLMHGCPVIGTPLALRGYLDESSRPYLLTASTVDDYLRAIAACKARRQELSQDARQDFLDRFSFPAAARRLTDILARRVASRP